jgi:3-deoxy-manno-octulosonate cytidylyltransferase (CMP-KDO synthetase)
MVGIVPSRMASARFPGKPLARLAGYPMIEHVYRRARRCGLLDDIYLATCDAEIYDAVVRFGGKAIMTDSRHARGTDRVAEAAKQIDADVVVNIQGDEPLIRPEAITQLCEAAAASPDALSINLANVITSEADFLSPHQVKVVCDRHGNALYMSRQPIPTTHAWGRTEILRQLGMVAFRRDFLETFAALPPTPLEQAESIDMLRAMEHGYRVKVVVTPYESFGVDTPADLELAESRLAADKLNVELFASA